MAAAYSVRCQKVRKKRKMNPLLTVSAKTRTGSEGEKESPYIMWTTVNHILNGKVAKLPADCYTAS